MNSRLYLLSAAGIAAAGSATAAKPEIPVRHSAKPNIVFVLADDMGIGDVGCYGQRRIATPNIDRLAAYGLRFTHHYAGSTISAPSRCALLTGKHTGHGSVRGNLGTKDGFDFELPAGETTVAEILKKSGYATACVGKWGLGGPGTAGSPHNKGFDYFFGYLSQVAAHRYYPDHLYENDRKVLLDGKTYSHFLIMDKGIEFIEQHADEPFFVYFAITPPHADLDYPDIGRYEGRFEEPPYDPAKKGNFKNNENPRATYASMIAEIDANVGRILETLEAHGVLDNTLFIFSSDNGVHDVGGHDPDYFDSNGPFRGYKRDLYEGGVRTPFVVSWPAVITRSRETGHISAFWDFLPTVCDLTGMPLPDGIDGISYLPTLLGQDESQREHEYIYYEFYGQGGKQSILKEGWKLVRLRLRIPGKIVEELYNLDRDPSETHNLIGKYPGKAKELRALAATARTENPDFSLFGK